ncbi:hypothetical protein IU403_09305 [Aerococcaceae bacterium zg-BR22]|nr:hypothetical protein [Aerococcaceae bacterium zg-BR22]
MTEDQYRLIIFIHFSMNGLITSYIKISNIAV